MEEQIIRTEYSEIMQKSYIDYAMSVIVSRALPDVRDGLKPVQRRTLYDMHELGIRYDRPFRKSARIVGDTMGKYHPHGDSSIYGALVVLAQDFKMGIPLVDGHGNFGSIEGDGAAAMRYTEARLQKITQEAFLQDLDKNVVAFQPNFDETEKEPEVLPARIPNLLVNGSEGIAVGMVTSIPPHNLGEVLDAVIAMIHDGSLTDQQLLEYIQGPDFPTGGIVVNKSELAQIYSTGSGKIRVRGKVETEKMKGGKECLVITEIPYTMLGANIGKFLNDVAALVETKKTTDITDISNQSSKEGIRIVIELRRGADPEYIKNLLYKKTRLEDTFGVNMLAVADGRPETLSLRQILEHHIDFQFEVTTKKYQVMLDRELKKKEVQEGLIRACDVIDLIIEILRGSKSQKQVKDCLVYGITDGIKFKSQRSQKQAAKLDFTEAQADAILEMRLYRLIGLEIDALMEEHKKTLANIENYTDILNNYSSMADVIIRELKQFKKEFARPRRTQIMDAEAPVLEEKAPEDIPVVFLMDRFGYARTVDESVYEKNRESADTENRYVIHVSTSQRLGIYTDTGKQHLLKVSDVPLGRYRDKGTPIDNLCNYDSSQEMVINVLPIEKAASCVILSVSSSGMIKRVEGSELQVSKRTVAASGLAEGDSLISFYPVRENSQIVLQSKKGFLLRLPVSEIPFKKKAAVGVRGMKLSEGDTIEVCHLLDAQEEEPVNAAKLPSDEPAGTIRAGGRSVVLSRLKIGTRDTKGTKPRG